MDTPTIFDLLDRLAFLRGMPAVIILLAAVFVAVVAWDMRPTIPALLVHYLMAGFLFVDVLDPRLAVVYTLAGLFVTAILLVTAWQVNWGRPPAGLTPEEAARLGLGRRRAFARVSLPERALLRLALAVIALVVGWLLVGSADAATSGPLAAIIPSGQNYLLLAIAGLLALGLIGLAATAEPLPGGIGLLAFLTGFALLYGFLDQSLAMTVALVVVQLVVALVVAYLAQARYLPADILD